MTQLALFVLFLFPALTISGQVTRSIAVAICLILCHPKVSKRLCEPGILLFTWFLWAAYCSMQGDYPQLALFGYHKRVEGLVTWILAISFGWLFWRSSTLDRLFLTCQIILGICLVAMIVKPDLYTQILYGHITICAFASIVACMLISKHISYILIAFPFILLTQNRSMILALAFGLLAYCIVRRDSILDLYLDSWKPLIYSILAILTLSIIAYPKLSKIDLSTLGTGLRTEFAKQGIQAIVQKPFMGYGIDTQSKILRPPLNDKTEHKIRDLGDGVYHRAYYGVDRCHNFFLDIAFQTGVIGLILWLFILTRMTYRTFLLPNRVNMACLCGFYGFLGYNLANPSGIPAMFLACLCVMGIEKKETIYGR